MPEEGRGFWRWGSDDQIHINEEFWDGVKGPIQKAVRNTLSWQEDRKRPEPESLDDDDDRWPAHPKRYERDIDPSDVDVQVRESASWGYNPRDSSYKPGERESRFSKHGVEVADNDRRGKYGGRENATDSD